MSLNYLFPKALAKGDEDNFTGPIADRLQNVIKEELNRLSIEHQWYSTRFHYLGTKVIPDSTRCSECGSWVIPAENAHRTSVIDSGRRAEGGKILCDQCWALSDAGRSCGW